jgi:predicted secreted Zn-dependent protease
MRTHMLTAMGGLVLASSLAMARPANNTAYEYYTVAGRSAAELHNNMIRRGPHLSGKNAYALTTMKSAQTGKLVQGKTCRASDYNVNMSFRMRLPRLRPGVKLSGAERGRWNAFAAFVRNHEETHRAIWLGCANEMERRVRTISAKSCGAWEAAEKKIVASIVFSCNAKHQAFDSAEQRRLAHHPFVRAAFGGGVKAVAAKKRRKANF